MPILKSRLGDWNVEHLHMWKDRAIDIKSPNVPIIGPSTRIATIGSCFAQEIADAMHRLKLHGAMHPAGLFYTSRSIRQEFERIFGDAAPYTAERYWKVAKGYIHPFKSYDKAFESADALRSWSDTLDKSSEALFRNADVIVITLGLIEAWRSKHTGNFYRQIPHPEAMKSADPEFYRLTVADMLEDLKRIRDLVRSHTSARMILTVSPVPLYVTFTPLDVRVANTESKTRIRAAVSEFIERHPDVFYFHSYELVTTAERLSDFMLEDGRHVSRQAVDYILQQFMMKFAGQGVPVPAVDKDFLTPPAKTAGKVRRNRQPLVLRAVRALYRRIAIR